MELPKGDGKTKFATTSWIPEEYAVEGKFLELKNRENGEWINGWKVVMVGNHRMTRKEVEERSRDHQKTRKASDI
jgi:hypothetical protein